MLAFELVCYILHCTKADADVGSELEAQSLATLNVLFIFRIERLVLYIVASTPIGAEVIIQTAANGLCLQERSGGDPAARDYGG